MTIRHTAKARVRFVIDVPAGSSWEPRVTLDQIMRQAGEETCHKVEKHLRLIGGVVIGKPEVTAILVTEDADPYPRRNGSGPTDSTPPGSVPGKDEP